MTRFDHVAIDGPAASGKTTAARLVARRLGYLYLDTGSMYRALAHLALLTETDLDNEPALIRLWNAHPIRVTLDPAGSDAQRILTGDVDVTDELASSAVTAVVSTVAAYPRVREAMVREQRRIASDAPVVMAGRDIGTVVLPEAPHKVFLTASVEARVQRRRAEMQASGVDVSARRLREEIEERDRLDQNRATSPLRPAADAVVIDSTRLSADAVADKIVSIVRGTASQ
ncbi:MAG: (d)CMP kinase [Candidatus Eremiobacteraeota bacterium]|nr:(d)CMP kinase [Candidatus Eremiobacteraeota bacterium]